ncbi:MAG: hypothetical protein ABL986_22240 [Vicinamibacterales bacterium]
MQPRHTRRVYAAALAVVVSVVSLSSSLLAHHGWGGNGDAEFELTGTVEVPLKLAGPHATMKIKADGKVWDLTLSAPGRVSASGLTESLIPVGATVKAHGHRNKDANRFEIKTERLTFNNKVYNVYPDRD